MQRRKRKKNGGKNASWVRYHKPARWSLKPLATAGGFLFGDSVLS